jgi:aminopeptidase C
MKEEWYALTRRTIHRPTFMRKLAIALLAVAAALPVVAKNKRHKDKRFEPVAIANPAQAAGRYVGIDPDFVIELRGNTGTLRNFNRTGTLTHLFYEGSVLKATVVYPGERREVLQATFVNRIKNGETAFGLVLRMDVHIDGDVTLQDLFCRRE